MQSYVMILSPIQGELLAAVATIIIGIVMEKWYVSWWSVGTNMGNGIITMTTLDLERDLGALTLLLMYLVFGGVSAWKGWKRAYFLFGCKTYGALTLTLGMLEIPWATDSLLKTAAYMSIYINNQLELLLFGWAVTFALVHIIGEFYNRTVRRGVHEHQRPF
jgi:hypothetical protein